VKHLEKFRAYAIARARHDDAKKAASDAYAEQAKLEKELIDVMLEEKVKSFTLENGMSVGMRKRFDLSVNKDNEEQVRTWLMETEGDVEPFCKKVLYKPAVVKMLKDKAAEDKLDMTTIPEFLNLKTTPGITVRGWQGASDEDE
jgi:hypothetical protein